MPRILRAVPADAPALTEIAFAAKRHWGYPESSITLWSALLTITPEFISISETCKAVAAGQISGFGALVISADELTKFATLEHLWVRPKEMRRGIGRELFQRAVARARELGCQRIEIESDPNAAAFYERMGARQIDASPITGNGSGRTLPKLVFELREKPGNGTFNRR